MQNCFVGSKTEAGGMCWLVWRLLFLFLDVVTAASWNLDDPVKVIEEWLKSSTEKPATLSATSQLEVILETVPTTRVPSKATTKSTTPTTTRSTTSVTTSSTEDFSTGSPSTLSPRHSGHPGPASGSMDTLLVRS